MNLYGFVKEWRSD